MSGSVLTLLGASFIGPGLPVGLIPASGLTGRGLRVTVAGAYDFDQAEVRVSDLGGRSLGELRTEPRGRMGFITEVRLAESVELVTGFGTPTYIRLGVLDEARPDAPLSLAIGLGVSSVMDFPRPAAGIQLSRELSLSPTLGLRPIASLWYQPHKSVFSVDIPEGELSGGSLLLRRERTQAFTVPMGVDLVFHPAEGQEVAFQVGGSMGLPVLERWAVQCVDCEVTLNKLESTHGPVIFVGARLGPLRRAKDDGPVQPPAPSGAGPTTGGAP